MRAADGAVWITGASSGIGRALALAMVRRGYRVAASARGADGLAELRDASDAPERLLPVPVDVTDEAAMVDAVARIEDALGPLAGAVLNAGTHRPVTAESFAAAPFRTLLDVNVMGVVHALVPLLPRMMARRSGTLAIVSSVAAWRGLPTSAAYGASKAALVNLAESLKLELDRHDVRVALVMPGFVRTPLTDRNPFPMPFLMDVETAAGRTLAGLEGDGFEITFPRRFTWQLKVARMLPYRLYFPLIHRLTGR